MNKNIKTNFKKGFVGAYILLIAVGAISPVFMTQAEAPNPIEILQMQNEENEIKMSDRAKKIDAYFAKYNLPLEGYGKVFVKSAKKYDVNWRLVAAISFVESTGGLHACKGATYSAFGWGSCKIDFNSYEESIDIVTKNLGGHNPNTARYYADKDLRGILDSYNPPSIVPDYADRVIKQMEIIDSMEIA